MAMAGDLLLVNGVLRDSYETCAPGSSDLLCGATWVYRKNGSSWNLIKEHVISNSGFSWAYFLDEETYYIISPYHSTAPNADFMTLQVFDVDPATGEIEERTSLEFEGPKSPKVINIVKFDGRFLTVLDRWNLDIIEYDESQNTWSTPRVKLLTELFPEDSSQKRYDLLLNDGIAYFFTDTVGGGSGLNSLGMVDLASGTSLGHLDVTEFSFPWILIPYWKDEQLIIYNWVTRLGEENAIKNVYELQSGSWTWVSEFAPKFEDSPFAGQLFFSDDYIFESRYRRFLGMSTVGIVIYGKDTGGQWREVGFVAMPNGEYRTRKGWYDFVVVASHGATAFVQHRGDNTIGYRLFEIPDISYYFDVDEDQMPDGWEVQYGYSTSKLDDYVNMDSDLDSLTEAEEFRYMTSPMDSDTDDDGMPDGYEVARLFDPLDSVDGGIDSDGDGVINSQEYRDLTDPFDATSFRKDSLPPSGGGGGFVDAVSAIGLWLLILIRRFTRRHSNQVLQLHSPTPLQ